MRFFIDHCISDKLARALDALDFVNEIRHVNHDERFSPTTRDVDWIGAIGRDEPKWHVLSVDVGILRNPQERRVLHESGLKFFLLSRSWAKMMLHEQAWRLIKIWPRIMDAGANVRGRVFEVSAGGGGKVLRVE